MIRKKEYCCLQSTIKQSKRPFNAIANFRIFIILFLPHSLPPLDRAHLKANFIHKHRRIQNEFIIIFQQLLIVKLRLIASP